MKKLIALLVMGFAFTVSASAFAETPQQKMGRCSSAAKGLKGEEFKAAKNKCLSSKDDVVAKDAAPAAKKETPQERMSRCSKEAKGLKGEEFKATKNKCLSNKG
jgi:hypothetical protein